MSRHVLTSEEGMKGALESARVRKGVAKYVAKTQKEIAKMGLEADTIKEVLSFAKSIALTPVGSIVIAWLIVDFFQKVKYIDETEAIGLKAVVTSADIVGALGGGQGIAGVVGSLATVVK